MVSFTIILWVYLLNLSSGAIYNLSLDLWSNEITSYLPFLSVLSLGQTCNTIHKALSDEIHVKMEMTGNVC